MLDAAKIRRLFDYDPITGSLVWKIDTGKRRLVGSVAGAFRKDGYRRVGINKKDYYVHRLVWAFHKGFWPSKGMDHINGNTRDNRIENLREANQSQNNANSKRSKRNSTGFRGTRLCSSGRYSAQIMINYKSIHLGYFATVEEASDAYTKAAIEYFNEYRRAG